eukprot:1160412-Pelagomonas_calceolata.AAC.3
MEGEQGLDKCRSVCMHAQKVAESTQHGNSHWKGAGGKMMLGGGNQRMFGVSPGESGKKLILPGLGPRP